MANQKLLMAWIKDPEMGEGFWDICAKIGFKESAKQTAEWKPWKAMVDKYGESEAEEMRDEGKIKAPPLFC